MVRNVYPLVQTQVKSSQNLSPIEAQGLVMLLSTTDQEDMLKKALVTITNAAAFTSNQDVLREAGCLGQLNRLVSSVMTPSDLLTPLLQSINNMAMNTDNQKELQLSIPSLIALANDSSNGDIQLSSLQALTNLSVTPTYHAPYTRTIQSLYEQLDRHHGNIRIQILKLLVNLSDNPSMVPHLLAAKAPSVVLDLLLPSQPGDIVLRWLTILANIMSTSKDSSLTSCDLPTNDKAASPETMYAALFGLNNRAKLKSQVFVLSKNTDDGVRAQALKLYGCLLA
ncbi:hypothetical protein CAPTEDRAFT_227480 [Capitella teleta]|uniref:Armadillo repeat-containing domain-containing protein n=1 Tax=Capitella teleta TaxID=283909 RepID=R7UYG7_CAPTE|nr:hypothetical protein CAPTEDRAFT_227480 [Capitella teleta]|eukprot:ELU11608.1 hypothetical protein CAPTEDRAFT_227480 [Capitella teleta]